MLSARATLLLLPLLGLPSAIARSVPAQKYTLEDLYQGETFFDGWEFWTGPDPTSGFVQYVDQETATQNGLIDASYDLVYMGVDYTTKLNPVKSAGRQSVRISTSKTYTEGLIIGDFAHMPGGICGTWPAFWSFGPNWPYSGEIDMVEGQNSQGSNLMSLHAGGNCSTIGEYETGTLENADCWQYDPNQYGSGCGVSDKRMKSFGTGFNSIGGGVYATQWTDSFIRIWFFPRNNVPFDIEDGAPDPTKWGKPSANFQGDCDFATHFLEHQIVFDTTFCGAWAGAVFDSDPVCSKLATSCVDYVADNPKVFKDAYWLVNYVAVYTQKDVPGSSTSLLPSSTLASTASVTPASSLTGVGAGATTTASGATPPPSATTTLSISQSPAVNLAALAKETLA